METTAGGTPMTVLMASQARGVAEWPNEGSVKAPLPGLESVYREHHGFVWRNARRLGGDPAALDDIVHEVFLVVARRLHEFRGEAQIRTWLFAITYHVIKRFRRDHARYAKRIEDYSECRESQSTVNESGSEDAGCQLRQMLLRLSEPKRLVFIMAELEGMTSVEIGQCLSMNTGTVDTRLRAARQELQRMIEREQARMRRYWP